MSSTPPVAGRVELDDVDAAGALRGERHARVAFPHGSGVGPCAQFSERARMRALDVLPQPRGPENRYAWLMRCADSAVRSGSVTCSWPTTSAKVAGRYLRKRASATVGTLRGGTDAPDRDVGVRRPGEK
ncbi:hypothetical protein GCM10020366_10670 [Saccharopolyspora gregorii]|uniref:Uncharacterized protein n=1 Tax=Saccharopolyspora gregorii TaxID=33914 RepID=A0ABP6RM58_9PSEU